MGTHGLLEAFGREWRAHDDRAGRWRVCVSGNWRAVFRFEEGEAVDLIDYH